MNSTIGLAGFIDVASGQGLPLHDEDLGQTLGRWGVGQGWFLMLPLLGPSTNRDFVGFTGDNFAFVYNNPTDPLTYVDSFNTLDRLAVRGVDLVDNRAQLLGSEKILKQQLDPYVFYRTAYLEHRQSLVYDGNPPQEDEDFGDEDEPAEGAADTPPAAAEPEADKPAPAAL
jgi:phospholipid-binding lipoprotein MlaA